MVKRLINDTVS